MRVALVIYGSLDTLSGGYLYDRRLVEHLRRRGHTVDVVSLPWRSYAAHLADNLRPTWRRTLRELHADLLLEDELNHPSLAWMPKPAGVPVVAIVHHLRSSEEHPAPLRPLYRAVERRYLRRVDGCLYNSATTRAAAARLLGGNRGALSNAPPGVVAFPAGNHLLRAASLSLHEADAPRPQPPPLRLLAAGSVIPRKNIHTLLDALAQTPPAACTLDVAGSLTADPAYAAALRAQIARLGLGERVRLHGALPDAGLARLYAASHLFALPSYEGFGIVYLEAMSYGLPVIASSAGAAHEIVTHGLDGYLVAPGDAATLAAHLRALAADPALLAAMSEAARARFARHPTWDETFSEAAAWLEDLAQ